jgi:hypothetical protein
MNYSTAVFLINKDVRAINAAYEVDAAGKGVNISLFKTFDKTIKPGDLVVVPTTTRVGMTVCKVTEVDVDFDIDQTKDITWVIDVVDQVEYAHTLEIEQQAIGAIKSAELRKKREDLAKNLLADKLPELQSLSIANMSSAAGCDLSPPAATADKQ